MTDRSTATQRHAGNWRSPCKYYDECNAPLCPLDPDLHKRTWFADEDICRSANARRGLEWVKRQRKIKRKIAHLEADGGYFKLELLERDCVIGKGMRGLDPDAYMDTESRRIRSWMKRHPPITEAMREAGREKAGKGIRKDVRVDARNG